MTPFLFLQLVPEERALKGSAVFFTHHAYLMGVILSDDSPCAHCLRGWMSVYI